MWLSHFWLGLGWIVYGTLHSILASAAFKDSIERQIKNHFKYYRLFYIIFASITLLIMLYWLWTTPSYLFWNPGILSKASGILITLTGIIIMALCIRKYIRSLQIINSLVSDLDPVLYQKGLHSHVRHPLYLGTFLFIWGSFLCIPYASLFVTNFIITVYTLVGIRFEEKKLIKLYGETYTRYMQQVPMIWPRFKKSAT
jgi:methanethiol S-methyltransferase